MCGIVGFRGEKNAVSILLSALERLEYRGYDSAGISYVQDGKLFSYKALGRIFNLRSELDGACDGVMGIAHTRWATHGKVATQNSHPHTQGKITVVHNGIIENYLEIRQELKEQGYSFYSDTDTEVVAALLDSLYQESFDMHDSIVKLMEKLVGSYALGIICADDLDTLYAVKKDSPLIVAESNIGKFIASDVPAILKYSNSYYVLNDYEFVQLDDNGITFFDKDGKLIDKDLKMYDALFHDFDKGDYEHYMLKEIFEQPKVLQELMEYYSKNDWQNLRDCIPDFSKYKRVDIVACGSAYHAGLVWKNLLEKYLEIETYVHLASEFRYQKLFLDSSILTICISQSGETADTLKALQIAKDYGSDTLTIVNVYESSIARSADFVLYTRAGVEVAVATTKGYTSQIMVASLLVSYFKGLELEDLSKVLGNVLQKNYLDIAQKIYQEEHIFFIGRGVDYALSMEGALKLKEISYIHAESYAAGELKHGTISLIDEGCYVFGIISDISLKDKVIGNLKEVSARGAKVILIITEDLVENYSFVEDIILVPRVSTIYQSIVTILPLQMIAYSVAKLRGCDIDKPKNLAKSVTVE